MLCSKCGHHNVVEAKFCAKCGTVLQTPDLASGTNPAVTDGLKWGIVIGAVIIPLIGIIMGVIFLNDTNPEKKAVGKLWIWTGLGAGLVYALMTL